MLALMVSAAWATSPYDMPYGVQWNFQIGAAGNDGANSITTTLDVTSDGTVFVLNRTGGSNTWGSGTTGGVESGVGAITPQGQLLYGTTLRSLPGMNSPGQNYTAGISAAGSRAYGLIYAGQTQYWTGEDGKDSTRGMVYSVDSSGLSSIANQHSLSVYADNTGTLRTDPLMPITTGLTPVAGQNRSNGSALRDSTLDMVMVMDMVAGDFATAGDYEGYNLRSSGTAAAYLPGIGVYNFNTNTLSGPAKQPILTYSGPNATWSNCILCRRDRPNQRPVLWRRPLAHAQRVDLRRVGSGRFRTRSADPVCERHLRHHGRYRDSL